MDCVSKSADRAVFFTECTYLPKLRVASIIDFRAGGHTYLSIILFEPICASLCADMSIIVSIVVRILAFLFTEFCGRISIKISRAICRAYTFSCKRVSIQLVVSIIHITFLLASANRAIQFLLKSCQIAMFDTKIENIVSIAPLWAQINTCPCCIVSK